jgi:hypothetical protein
MWITHLPTKDEGAYIDTTDGKLNVWSITHKKVVEWDPKDTEIVLDNQTDDFSLMLKVMVSEHGKNAFKPDHVLVTCLDAIKWYLEHEKLHYKTLDERLQTMQEVLYFAAGEFELGCERDKIILFIHNTLPHLMMGSLMGFKLAKEFFTSNKPLFDPIQDSQESDIDSTSESESDYSTSESDSKHSVSLNSEPEPRKRFCWC